MKEFLAPVIDDLVAIVEKNYTNPDVALIRRAYDFAALAHGDTKRASGHPYITHPTAVACILAEMRLGIKVVAAGLLHDVLEDTPVTFDDIKREFGTDMAELVDSVSKLQQVYYRGSDRHIENLRKMFLAMASDFRAILVKFADRLHNLQTLSALPVPDQKRIAREALEIHAPIASRLGMGEMKGDLEDAALRYDNPEAYSQTVEILTKQVGGKNVYIPRVIQAAIRCLAQGGVTDTTIHGRVKRLYSFYKKLERYHHDISRVYDVIAVRITVPGGIDQCYSVLGMLHHEYTPVPGRIKDYIAQPKPNGYQSLHTTVFCEDGEMVEFQIRTQEMDEFAEYGLAAHWRYKESSRRETTRDARWMREIMTIRKEILSNHNFLQTLEEWKLDLFRDRIFVLTPKGDVIDLPDGATPIDFAYAIHTDVGDRCITARVNGQMVRLDVPLGSGMVCEIVTDKNRKGPSLDWLKIAKTRHARQKIRENAKKTLPNFIAQFISPRRKKKI